MADLSEECQAARSEVEDEFSIIKKLSTTLTLPADSRNAIRRYSVVAMYAAWEGFVVSVFSAYAQKINAKGVLFSNCDKRIGAQLFFQQLQLDNVGNRIEKRESIVQDAIRILSSPVHIRTPISTDSNVDYASLNAIMHKLGLAPLPEETYKDKMAKFLSMRCKLAHGTKIKVSDQDISEISNLVTSLMDDLITVLVESLEGEKFKTTV